MNEIGKKLVRLELQLEELAAAQSEEEPEDEDLEDDDEDADDDEADEDDGEEEEGEEDDDGDLLERWRDDEGLLIVGPTDIDEMDKEQLVEFAKECEFQLEGVRINGMRTSAKKWLAAQGTDESAAADDDDDEDQNEDEDEEDEDAEGSEEGDDEEEEEDDDEEEEDELVEGPGGEIGYAVSERQLWAFEGGEAVYVDIEGAWEKGVIKKQKNVYQKDSDGDTFITVNLDSGDTVELFLDTESIATIAALVAEDE